MDQQLTSLDEEQDLQQGGAEGSGGPFWHRLRPDLRAALTVGVFVVPLEALSIMTAGLGGISLIFSKPVQVALFVLQGVLVGKYVKERGLDRGGPLKLAFMSAIWLQIACIATNVIVFGLMVGLTLGAAAAFIPAFILNSLGMIAFNCGLTTLACWLSGRYGGKQLFLAAAVIIVVAVILMIILVVAAVALLAVIGIAIFSGA